MTPSVNLNICPSTLLCAQSSAILPTRHRTIRYTVPRMLLSLQGSMGPALKDFMHLMPAQIRVRSAGGKQEQGQATAATGQAARRTYGCQGAQRWPCNSPCSGDCRRLRASCTPHTNSHREAHKTQIRRHTDSNVSLLRAWQLPPERPNDRTVWRTHAYADAVSAG